MPSLLEENTGLAIKPKTLAYSSLKTTIHPEANAYTHTRMRALK